MSDQAQSLSPMVDKAKLEAALLGVVGGLEREAARRVSLRKTQEERWLLDEAQRHGKYDEVTDRQLQDSKRSRLFVNETRPKCEVLTAKLYNLLFPTDDKPWGIKPTPVPKLTAAAEDAERVAAQHAKELQDAQAAQQEQDAGGAPAANDNPAPPMDGAAPPEAAAPAPQPAPPAQPDQAMQQMQAKADVAKEAATRLQGIIAEAKRRCELMAAEIEDQFEESNYAAIKRDQIESAVNYGTGVTKGPVTGYSLRKGWKREPAMAAVNDNQGQPAMGADGQPKMQEAYDDHGAPQYASDEYQLQMSDGGNTPAMIGVNIWNFFPDPDAPKVENGNGNFERDLMTAKQVRSLQHLEGYRKDQIRDLLRDGARGGAPDYLVMLRNITGTQQTAANLYHVWHYAGPLAAADMMTLALATGDDATAREVGEIDPLTEVNAVVCFCQGKVIKFAIYPYDSGECMYSVFNLVKDETSPFGYGLPAIMRDPQRALNAAWRAMMDNAGLIVSPNIVVAKDKVNPENGLWEFGKGPKIWLTEDGLPDKNAAFGMFEFTSRQTELANIIALAKQFIDDMTAIPQISQGNPESTPQNTAFGTTVLMTNASNIIFSRYVKNFDDDVTVPDVRRTYDWNMQFSKKDEIKGDYNVVARGSSVLLMRELQASTLFAIAVQLGGHPVYGPMLKNRELLRKIFQTNMVPDDEVVLTDVEIDAILANAAANDPAAAAEKAKADAAQQTALLASKEISARVSIAQMQEQSAITLATIARETALIKMAQESNMTVEDLRTKLQISREQAQHKERMFAAEIGFEQRNAEQARAAGEEPTGSGGSISAGSKPKPN
jgi:hypothetical protein